MARQGPGLSSRSDRRSALVDMIAFVANQQGRHETPRDRIHAAEVAAMAGAGPVRLLATG